MRPSNRVIAAFLIAPGIVAAATTAIFLQPVNLLVIFGYAAVVIYAHTVLFAVPVYLWLQRMGWLRISTVLLGSALIGALPLGLFLLLGPHAAYVTVGSEVDSGNGISTLAGILSKIEFPLATGGIGLATGIVWLLIAGKPAITPKHPEPGTLPSARREH